MVIKEGFVTIADMARVLEMSRQRVWMYVKEKRLPSQRVGRMFLVASADFRKFLEQRAAATNGGAKA